MHTNNPAYKDNLIVKLTFNFALDIVAFCEELDREHKYAISRQLIRSGTSVGANVREAQNAESIADFIHKLKISLKELHETEYWLLLCKESPSYPTPSTLLEDIVPIWKVLNKIISTSVQTRKLKKR